MPRDILKFSEADHRREVKLLMEHRLALKAPYTGDGIEYLEKARPYLATYNEMGWEDVPRFDDGNFYESPYILGWQARDVMTQHYAWAVPDEHALETIAALSPIVEVGAGSGYWAKELRKFGAKVAPYDRYPYPLFNGHISFSHAAISKGGPDKALRDFPERTLFLCWPSYQGNWAAQAVKLHRGEYVAYVGEGSGGCTGDDELHVLLELLYEEVSSYRIPRWWGVRDWLTVYRRKAEFTPELAIELELALHALSDLYSPDE